MKITKEDLQFLEMLSIRVPEKKRLVKILEDLLGLEREAIYRRLRGQVSFPFSEIMQISKKLDISLDNLSWMGVGAQRVCPSRIVLVDLLHPKEDELVLLEAYGETLSLLEHAPKSEIYGASNTLPQMFYVDYDYLFRFIIFKLKCQQIQVPKNLHFSDVNPPQRIIEIYKKYKYYHLCSKITNLIMDPWIFESVVNDIEYYREVEMIDTKDVLKLKEDLFALVDELEKRTVDGVFKTGNIFNVFISNTILDTHNVCININDEVNFCITKTFFLSDTYSTDYYCYQQMLIKMHSLVRTSTMISGGSAELVRLEFLKKQREMISRL